jgi:predicted amidohydrolase YtcJ
VNGALVLRNARIWTGDPARPWADTAIALDGRFAFVGRASDADVPSGASILDAEGRLVVPGFIDGHAHVLLTGFAARAVDLKGVPSVYEAARRVAERAASTPAGGWVRGVGWDQNEWPGARFPHRSDLDAATPDHPVALDHTSGHCIWNTAALAPPASPPPRPCCAAAPSTRRRQRATHPARQRLAAHRRRRAPSPRARRAVRGDGHAHRLGVTSIHAMNAGAASTAMLCCATTAACGCACGST